MKAIHVHLWIDPSPHIGRLDVIRERDLNEQGMDLGISAQVVYRAMEALRWLSWIEANIPGHNSYIIARRVFQIHETLVSWIVAHQHRSKRRDGTLFFEFADLIAYRFTDFRRNGFAEYLFGRSHTRISDANDL